jgi:hypothetical protein
MISKATWSRIFCGALLTLSAQAFAEELPVEPKVTEELTRMVNYFEKANSLTFKIMTTTEDVSSALQKLQFDTMIEGAIQRPNKVYYRKTGKEQTSLWYDGATLTVYDREAGKYAKMAFTGDLSQLVDKLDALGIDTPLAGLFHGDILKHVEDQVFKGDFYGATEVAGRPANHMTFRQDSIDWQLWTSIETAEPVKIVFTSKMLAGAPQFQIFLKDLAVDKGDLKAELFNAVIPKDVDEVPFEAEDDTSSDDDDPTNGIW